MSFSRESLSPGPAYIYHDDLAGAAFMEAYLYGAPPSCELAAYEFAVVGATTDQPTMSPADLEKLLDRYRENIAVSERSSTAKWWQFWRTRGERTGTSLSILDGLARQSGANLVDRGGESEYLPASARRAPPVRGQDRVHLGSFFAATVHTNLLSPDVSGRRAFREEARHARTSSSGPPQPRSAETPSEGSAPRPPARRAVSQCYVPEASSRTPRRADREACRRTVRRCSELRRADLAQARARMPHHRRHLA